MSSFKLLIPDLDCEQDPIPLEQTSEPETLDMHVLRVFLQIHHCSLISILTSICVTHNCFAVFLLQNQDSTYSLVAYANVSIIDSFLLPEQGSRPNSARVSSHILYVADSFITHRHMKLLYLHLHTVLSYCDSFIGYFIIVGILPSDDMTLVSLSLSLSLSHTHTHTTHTLG